jgi:hypothetical protein
MKEVSFQIKSVTPMLFHNVESMLLKKPSAIKHDVWEESDEVFQSRLYREGGKLVIPSRVWKGLMISAAKKSGMRQVGKRSGYADMVKALVFIQNGFVIEEGDAALSTHKAFVAVQKSKVLRIWPKAESWSGKLTMIIGDEKQLPVEVVRELLTFGGAFVGIGDYRPEFGRYTVQ